MGSYNTNEFKGGLKILIDNIPMVIVENQFVSPGKGQAFNRVKLRNLYNGRVIEKTFKSGENCDAADVIELDVTYSYYDGEYYIFMQTETFEQYTCSETALGETKKWITEQDVCSITLFNGSVIAVTAPNFVNLTIKEADPGLKGDTAGTGGKPAILETGATVRVPLFVQPGEKIRVDTRTGEYASRVKD